MASLEEQSALFAAEIQSTLDGVLPGERTITSTRFELTDRYIVKPDGERGRIPLFVDGEHLADLDVAFYLDLDRTRKFLKTVRSEMSVKSVLDRNTPLYRYDYRADMVSDPVAHWQIHAERGALSHLLTRANAIRPRMARRPHDMSSVHFPVGGERFRPCLEDLLQVLVSDCGIDRCNGWKNVLRDGRERWRRRQISSAVRDLPHQAAEMLAELGWQVTAPAEPVVAENLGTLHNW